MGFFSTIGKLLSGETISFEKTTHVNLAKNLLTGDKQSYVGEWRGAHTNLLIKSDGTINYRREETIGETTNTDTVSGPINQFDGASFVVGVLGQNTRFEVAAPPVDETMIVNGEVLQRV
jgi:hypothetical protein